MGWSGGSFTRTNGTYTGDTVWQDDKTNGFKIQASRHDTHDEDLADGINACLTKDSSNSPSAQLTWLKSQYYGGTSGGTAAAQTITMSPAHGSYQTGEIIAFKPGAMSTGATTLNKNSLGAKTIKRLDGTDLQPGDLDTTRMAIVVYDGTNYILASSQDVRPVLRSTVFSSTNNSLVETTVLTYTVPANTLKPSASSTGRKLRSRANLVVTNDSGGFVNYMVRCKFGSTTFFDQNVTVANGITTLPIIIETEVTAANTSTSVQSAVARVFAPAHGAGGAQDYAEYADPAQDITAAKDLVVTVQMDTASANAGFTICNAFAEVI